MSKMDELADELAIRAIDLEEKLGDEALIKRIAEGISNFSPTMEETFLTAVRIRRAHRHADRMILDLGGKPAPAAQAAAAPQAPPSRPAEPDDDEDPSPTGGTSVPVVITPPPDQG